MKTKVIAAAASCIFLLLLLMLPFSIVTAQNTINDVYVELSHGDWYSTHEDSISNVPIMWDHHWLINYVNNPDKSGLAVINPKVTLKSPLDLVRFGPDWTTNPEPGLYVWDFTGLEMVEAAHLPISFWEHNGIVEDRPRFSATRSVDPEHLTETTTSQIATVQFKLEEELPPGINHISVRIGTPIIAYQEYVLVKGEVVSQVPVEGWDIWTDGVVAFWSSDPSRVEVGETYVFRATLSLTKSPELSGSPLYKPTVMIGYDQWDHSSPIVGSSASIEYLGMQVTYSADGEYWWNPSVGVYRRDLILNEVVSSIVGTEPPFYTLSTLKFTLHSNADLHVYDPEGRHTGLNYENGEVENQITKAEFSYTDGQVITIPDPMSGGYRAALVGRATGSYGLTIEALSDSEPFLSESYEGEITIGQIHASEVAIPVIGQMGLAPPSIIPGLLKAKVNIDPDTLNLRSKDKWVTAYIKPPKGYDVENTRSVRLWYGIDSIAAKWTRIQHGVLMAKFSKAEVISLLGDIPWEACKGACLRHISREVELTIMGQIGETQFVGTDTIRIICR